MLKLSINICWIQRINKWYRKPISVRFFSYWSPNHWKNIIKFIFCCCFSVAKSSPTLCDPMDCSTPGLPVLHRVPEFARVHVHWVSDAVQPSHLLSSSSPTFNLSHHEDLFQWVGRHRVLQPQGGFGKQDSFGKPSDLSQTCWNPISIYSCLWNVGESPYLSKPRFFSL